MKYLNRTGKELFQSLEDPINADQIVQRFSRRYPEVPSGRIREDVLAFMKQLLENGSICLMETESVDE